MGLLNWLREKRRRREHTSFENAAAERPIYFEGGTGESVEAAIVVRGARFDLEGTCAEFAWLEQRYGQKDTDWKLVSQYHGKHENRDIDTFEIRLADGTSLTLFFDCTESFGKFPPPSFWSTGPKCKGDADDTVP